MNVLNVNPYLAWKVITTIQPANVRNLISIQASRIMHLLLVNNYCHIFTARRYASAVLAVIVCLSVRLSVRLSVCHKSELYKDG